MRAFFCCGVLALCAGAAAARPVAEEVMTALDALAARPLWPGFDPRQAPVAMFDGTHTRLFRHPSPPPELLSGVAPGQHPLLRANSSVELGGVTTATVLLDERASARAAAGVVIHELFHVHETRRHKDWFANELDALLYPDESVNVAAAARLEAALFNRARAGSACAAAAALEQRRRRMADMPAAVATYERAAERYEGLAQYVEDLALGAARPWPEALPLRERVYFSGQTLALLLDRHAPGWKERLDAGETRPLDELLAAALPGIAPCGPDAAARAAARRAAEVEIAALRARRAARERELTSAAGHTLVVEAGTEPLWPAGFDPLNLERLSGARLAHRRWVKLKNGGGELEVTAGVAVTEGQGDHPLTGGVRRLTLAGLAAAPTIERDGAAVTVAAPGFTARFKDAKVTTRDRQVIVTLR